MQQTKKCIVYKHMLKDMETTEQAAVGFRERQHKWYRNCMDEYLRILSFIVK